MSDSKYDNSDDSFEIIPDGTITSVPEFYASSYNCGIKKTKKDDICIIYTPLDTCCSGVFTTNKFLAAPVIVCRKQLKNTRNIKAVVVNSGIANACTGNQGYNSTLKTVDLAADYLNIKKENILVSSTGIIGKQLPMEKIEKGIRNCSKNLSSDGGHRAAGAILTTDKVKKEIAVRIKVSNTNNSDDSYYSYNNKNNKDIINSSNSGSNINNSSSSVISSNENNKDIIIGGIAKGSGMVAPNMATMLCFISTNVKVSKDLLDRLLVEGVENSFNSITIDGCQSTNDMVLIQANGQSSIEIKNEDSKYYDKFKNALFFVLQNLAKKMVKDGEGATKLIEINVIGAESKKDAKEIGMAIANSMLFKTAMFGEDLNWGRINTAVGSTDCGTNPDKLDIYFGDVLIVKDGVGINFNNKYTDKFIKNDEIEFTVDLNAGKEKRKIWTTDLSYDYVKINSFYRT